MARKIIRRARRVSNTQLAVAGAGMLCSSAIYSSLLSHI